MFKSTKLIDGFSTCFRQWRAKSHCSLLHGYSIEFKLTFKSNDLDTNNWVADFGFLKSEYKKNTTFKQWFERMFDHTTIIAEDDPLLNHFMALDNKDGINLVVTEAVGCEKFAKLVYDFICSNLHAISQNPLLELHSVECIENKKNSAIYYGK